MREVELLPKVQKYLTTDYSICERNGRFCINNGTEWTVFTPNNFQEKPFCIEEHLKIKGEN